MSRERKEIDTLKRIRSAVSETRPVLVLILLSAVVAFWLGWPFHAFSDNSLFEPVAAEQDTVASDQRPGIDRSRLVRVNWTAVTPDNNHVRLNLFDNTVLEAERVRIDRPANGGMVWIGRLTGAEDGQVVLSRSGNQLAGSVLIDGLEQFTILPAGPGDGVGLHIIREVDQTETVEPMAHDTIVPGLNARAPAAATLDEPCEDGSVIDILVAYSDEARDALGGVDAAEAMINQRISVMNQANLISEAGFTWRLVHVMEGGYQESGDMTTDLKRLQDGADGRMDSVVAARDQYQADLVALMVAQGNSNLCGLAYQMPVNELWFGEYAFSVSALDYAPPYSCNSLTMSHELGHNLGNAHNRENSATTPMNPFAFGHQSPDESFRTIMSYNCPGGCPRINLWSNPEVDFGGWPTGVEYEADPADAADIVRSMDDVRTTAANFRANCTQLLPSPTATDPAPTETPQPTATPTQSPTESPTESPTPAATATEGPPPASPTPGPSPIATSTEMPLRETAHVVYASVLIGR